MLKFNDFFHLPQLDQLIAQIVAEHHGLLIVAGVDPHPSLPVADVGLRPSGRTAVFRALIGELLSDGSRSALVVADQRDAIRVARSLQRRVRQLIVDPPKTYAEQIGVAIGRRPDLLIVDRLDMASAPAIFAAARQGLPVIAQLNTVCRGAEVGRHLRDLGASPEDLAQLGWVVAMERRARLCPNCSYPAPLDEGRLALARQALLGSRSAAAELAWLGDSAPALRAFDARGCQHCGFSRRQGDVAVFDVYHAAGTTAFPREYYMWHLIDQGLLPADDLIDHDAEQLYHTFRLLSASAQALAETNATLQRKLLELENANRVLEQRTAALGSLHDVGQALTRSTSLADLASRTCRYACELCRADRAILYLARPGNMAEILAANGWDERLLHQQLELMLGDADIDPAPILFTEWPPGIPEQHPDLAGFAIRAGFRVPLVADGRAVGLMIVQSTQKARFAPSEIMLLRAFADQAALAIHRAELLDARIGQERLEHELELARQVQQSVLPQVFPQVHGFTFAACNQPARQVGGDFYDIFRLDSDHIGVVIADVSGKGMPAALYMALTRSLLLAEAQRERSPRAALLNVNRLLRDLGDPHMFVTLFYGVLATATRQLTYARAGHDYPLLLRGGELIALEGTGIVLGFFDSAELRLSEEQLALQANDRLVLYTDGLTDVLGADGQRFDLERLKRIFQSHAQRSPEQLCAATFADLMAYQGSAEQYDDMTLLVIGVA